MRLQRIGSVDGDPVSDDVKRRSALDAALEAGEADARVGRLVVVRSKEELAALFRSL